MFNETSGRWIKILKVMSIVFFFAILLLGFLLGVSDANAGAIFDFDIAGDYCDSFLEFLIWFAIGAILAFVQLVMNMLLIGFLHNVQSIRISMSKLEKAQSEEMYR